MSLQSVPFCDIKVGQSFSEDASGSDPYEKTGPRTGKTAKGIEMEFDAMEKVYLVA